MAIKQCSTLLMCHSASHGHINNVQSLHKPIIIYMGSIILGGNMLYIEIPMASKGFKQKKYTSTYVFFRMGGGGIGSLIIGGPGNPLTTLALT